MNRKRRLIGILVIIFCLLILIIFAMQQMNKKSLEGDGMNHPEGSAWGDDQRDATTTIPGIVLWGDSITWGWFSDDGRTYPMEVKSSLQAAGFENVDVVVAGSTGEKTFAIAARSGARPIYIESDFTIPADCTPVELNLVTEEGEQYELSRFNEPEGLNPVTIAEVEGTLTNILMGTGPSAYTFTRLEKGDSVEVKAGAVMTTYGATHYLDYISVVQMGDNGGYGSLEDLIQQQNSIIHSRKANQERFLVVGMFTPELPDMMAYHEVMKKEYGDHYVNLAEFLADYDFTADSYELTPNDRSALAMGVVPSSMLVDERHLTGYGYTLLGKAVFAKIMELNLLE